MWWSFIKNQNIKCWLQKNPKKTLNLLPFLRNTLPQKSFFGWACIHWNWIVVWAWMGKVAIFLKKVCAHISDNYLLQCLLLLDEHRMEILGGFIKFLVPKALLSPISPPRWGGIHTLRVLVWGGRLNPASPFRNVPTRGL